MDSLVNIRQPGESFDTVATAIYASNDDLWIAVTISIFPNLVSFWSVLPSG